MGGGPPEIIPKLRAGDLFGLAEMIEHIGRIDLYQEIAPLFAEPRFGRGVTPRMAASAAGLLALRSAMPRLPMIRPGAEQALTGIVAQALSYLTGVQKPSKMVHNLSGMFVAFGKGGLPPTALGAQAAAALYHNPTSPFLMPPVSEMQVLLSAYQNLMNEATQQAKDAAGLQNDPQPAPRFGSRPDALRGERVELPVRKLPFSMPGVLGNEENPPISAKEAPSPQRLTAPAVPPATALSKLASQWNRGLAASNALPPTPGQKPRDS